MPYNPFKLCKGKIIGLVFILLTAFFLRAHRLSENFNSSDSVYRATFVSDSVPDDLSPKHLTDTSNRAAGNPLRMVFFFKGALLCFFSLVILSFCALLRLPITEFIWHFPVMLCGTFSVLFLFLILRQLRAKASTAFLAAAFFACMPLSVVQSRFFGAPVITGVCMQTLVIYLGLLHFENGSRKSAFLLGLSVAAYWFSHLHFPAMLPLLAYMAFVFSSGENFLTRVKSAVKKLLDPPFFVPALLGFLILCGGSLIVQGGPIGHMLQKSGTTGFYIPYWFNTCLRILDWPAFLLLFSGLILGVFRFRFILGKGSSILLFWGFIYTLPYWIKVGPQQSHVIDYYTDGLHGFILFSFYVLFESVNPPQMLRRWMMSAAAFVILLQLAALPSSIYDYDLFPALKLRLIHGTYEKDHGYKAAGYWIRENTQADDPIFSFANGGAGFEPNVAVYYMARIITGKYDAQPDAVAELLNREIKNLNCALVENKDYDFAVSHLPLEFGLCAEVFAEDGSSLIRIYRRGWKGQVDKVLTNDANPKFDWKYGNVKSLVGFEKVARNTGKKSMVE